MTAVCVGLEAVAAGRDGLDVARGAPVVTELHPQLADVPVDHVAFDLEGRAPDALQERLAGQDLARVRREDVEQGLLDRRELERFSAVELDGLLDEVDLDLATKPDLRHELRGDAARPADERVRASDDLVQRERDLNDVVGALFKSA